MPSPLRILCKFKWLHNHTLFLDPHSLLEAGDLDGSGIDTANYIGSDDLAMRRLSDSLDTHLRARMSTKSDLWATFTRSKTLRIGAARQPKLGDNNSLWPAKQKSDWSRLFCEVGTTAMYRYLVVVTYHLR